MVYLTGCPEDFDGGGDDDDERQHEAKDDKVDVVAELHIVR